MNRLAFRISKWDQDLVAYVAGTIAFAAVVPYLIYVVGIILFLDHPPGVLELAGGGQLWILNIGILAAIAVDLWNPKIRLNAEPNAHLLMSIAVLSLFLISILPWVWVAVASLSPTHAFGADEKAVSILGGPAALIATVIGYASKRISR